MKHTYRITYMGSLLMLLALLFTPQQVSAQTGPASNEIWYTTSNESVIQPLLSNECEWPGVEVVSNVYTPGDKGVITFRNPITSIGKNAFEAGINTNYQGTVSIILPEGVTEISEGAFANFDISKRGTTFNFTLPSTLTQIGRAAFYATPIGEVYLNVADTASVYFPYPNFTFGENIKNATLHVPSGMTNQFLQASVWKNFGDITDPSWPQLNEIWYTTTDGEPLTKLDFGSTRLKYQNEERNGDDIVWENHFDNDHWVLTLKYEGGEPSNLCKKILNIGYSLFNGQTRLQSITLPMSVRSRTISGTTYSGILDDAFYNCTNLSNITLPLCLSEITERTFNNCIHLQTIDIPEAVTCIGNYAFANCKEMTAIELPDNLTSIGVGAFSGCQGLTTINPLPEGITGIKDYTFKDCENLLAIELPDNLTSIGESAFENCRRLKSIVLPKGVTTVQDQVFSGCDSLASVRLHNNVNSIGHSSFNDCKSLNAIVIPTSVTTIGNMAFQGCSNIKEINLPDVVTSIGDSVFQNCSKLEYVEVSSSLTKFPSNAFANCKDSMMLAFSGSTPPTNIINAGLSARNLYMVPVGDLDTYRYANGYSKFPERVIAINMGDTRPDGKFTIVDAARLTDILQGKCADRYHNADVNMNGISNRNDLTYLVKIILGSAQPNTPQPSVDNGGSNTNPDAPKEADTKGERF